MKPIYYQRDEKLPANHREAGSRTEDRWWLETKSLQVSNLTYHNVTENYLLITLYTNATIKNMVQTCWTVFKPFVEYFKVYQSDSKKSCIELKWHVLLAGRHF